MVHPTGCYCKKKSLDSDYCWGEEIMLTRGQSITLWTGNSPPLGTILAPIFRVSLSVADYCLPELALGRPRITQRPCLCVCLCVCMCVLTGICFMQRHYPIDPVINLVCLLGSGRPADCKSVPCLSEGWDLGGF